jgi:glycosyltransferase involved in cell wall biosynthesis
MKKFKFLFVSTMEGYPWGGSEELWSRSAVWLVQNGHTVSASVHYWEQPHEKLDNLSKYGIVIQQRKISLWDFFDYGMTKLKRKPNNRPIGLNIFKKWVHSQRPDLICFSDGNFAGNPLMMEICNLHGIPYVIVGQANSVESWPKDDQSESIRIGLAKARKVFFVSRENLELAEFQIGMHLPHAEVVWNPFNVRYDVIPHWPEAAKDNIWKLACVARLETRAKGQDLILRVLAQPKWQARPLHLTFYGSGPNEKSLKSMTEMLDLSKMITFAGHVDNIEKVWRENHALILPSRFEGLPLAMLEAMLCNRMAIVNDVSVNKDVIIDNVTGFLASAPTLKLLDSAMEQAWARREEWEAMGCKAGEYIRSLIPKDPAADFAKRLVELAENSR